MRDMEEPVNRTGVSAGGSRRVNPHQEGEGKWISHRTPLKAWLWLLAFMPPAVEYFLIQECVFTYKYDFISDL